MKKKNKKNGIIIFILLIPLFSTTNHTVKLRVKNDGQVKILNKVLVPSYMIIKSMSKI